MTRAINVIYLPCIIAAATAIGFASKANHWTLWETVSTLWIVTLAATLAMTAMAMWKIGR